MSTSLTSETAATATTAATAAAAAAPPPLPAPLGNAAARRRRAAEIRARMEAVRERTLALVAPLPWETLRTQQIEILSPMVWDLGHIANFEELWVVERAAGEAPLERSYGSMFDAMLNPRKEREKLPLPDQPTLYAYLGKVRERSLETLERWVAEGCGDDGLLADGYAFELVTQHEEQHQETLLQALQVLEDPPYAPALRRTPPTVERDVTPGEMVQVPGGPFAMGVEPGDPAAGFAYDNEYRRHEVSLPPFWIDRFPVTQGEYLAFVEAGGYQRRELWTEAGWRWREETGAEAPGNWRRDGRRWRLRTMDRLRPLPEREIVSHVTYYEAEAYARFVGKRLPSEAEWEKAALWDPSHATERRHPWGDQPANADGARHANLDQLVFGPSEIGAYPDGASACGAEQMIGDVWEWTASDFTAYPGFVSYPYDEYSKVFFGPDYKVLRGGSWATRPATARGTFRNWDYPIRRQIFTGIRCARDAE